MHRAPLVVLLLLCLGVSAAAPADAKRSASKAIWGPVEVDGKSQFPIYEDLGVDIWQYVINWNEVAPTRPMDARNPSDPAYNWPAELDTALREARRRGIRVSVMLLGAPPWANGGRERFWAPDDPDDFATFAAATSKRFPAVKHWMIWGEPSKASNFQPLEPDKGKPLRTKAQLEGPRRYAQILDASYRELKQVSRRDLVIGGNTFTVGTVFPMRYMRAMKLPGGRRPRMDLWGHNPFHRRPPKLSDPRLPGGASDLSDIDDFVRALDRAHRRAKPRKLRRLKIFISEISIPTDHPNFEFNFHKSRRTQAAFIRAGLRIARRYKRIYTYGYLGLYDDELRPDGLQVERGLITRGGERKPAYATYRDG